MPFKRFVLDGMMNGGACVHTGISGKLVEVVGKFRRTRLGVVDDEGYGFDFFHESAQVRNIRTV